MAYRARLHSQAQWSALQALEKYFKWLLVLNQISTKKLGHDLNRAVELIDKKLPFAFWFDKSSREFVAHLNEFGQYQYLEMSYVVIPLELPRLDQAVWQVRRHCQPIAWMNGNDTSAQLQSLQTQVEISNSKLAYKFRIDGGELERVLDDKAALARRELVWQNMYFGGRHLRRFILRRGDYISVHTPLTLNPEILDDVEQLVFLPAHIRERYPGFKIEQSDTEPQH